MKKEVAYLVGPIENLADRGVNWRAVIRPRIEIMGIKTIDPTDYWKFFTGKDINDDGRQGVEEAIRNHDWEQLLNRWDSVWKNNEEWVTQADFLIGKFFRGINSVGSIREMQKAFDQCKPNYLIYDGDPAELGAHLLHLVLKWGRLFPNDDALIDFLERR